MKNTSKCEALVIQIVFWEQKINSFCLFVLEYLKKICWLLFKNQKYTALTLKIREKTFWIILLNIHTYISLYYYAKIRIQNNLLGAEKTKVKKKKKYMGLVLLKTTYFCR